MIKLTNVAMDRLSRLYAGGRALREAGFEFNTLESMDNDLDLAVEFFQQIWSVHYRLEGGPR